MKYHNSSLVATLLCCVLSVNTLIAQGNYSPGYIITLSNDTVHGYLSTVNTNFFKKCVFKKSMTDEISTYLPGEIGSYRYDNNGRFYISKTIPTETGKQVSFVEYLVKGKASVYYMHDEMDHYYAETEKDSLMELSERHILKKNDWGTLYYKQPAYYGKLKYLFRDCPSMSAEVDKTKLYQSDLIKLTKEYQNRVCTGTQCIVFEKQVHPVKVRFSVAGGVSFNRFSFGTLSRTDYSPGAFIGCNMKFENMFLASEQSTLNLGLYLQNYSNYKLSSYTYPDFKDLKNKTDVNVKVVSLKIPIAYHYTFSRANVRPYVGAGITNLFVLSQNKSLQGNFMLAPGESFPVYDFGALGVAGTQFLLKNNHLLKLELNYEYFFQLEADELSRLVSPGFTLAVGYSL